MLEKIVRVLANQVLRERRGLGQEIPMIDRPRAEAVDALELLKGRDDVEHRPAPHVVGMVQREAICDASATVVPCHVEAIRALGFDRFDVAGHDRGARVTYRLALDHPDRVRRAATLDIIPTIEQYERVDRFGARAIYHWYFLAQPAPFP